MSNLPPKIDPSVSRSYPVFISYRHADNVEQGRKWASWLHEAVESYEIPEELSGRVNQRGDKIPSTLYPVFRDEEELPADADLTTSIRRALENSNLLVVICSPRAVQSKFVAEEIRHFKELGKGGRILAMIVDGEPNASDDPAKQVTSGGCLECFPEPLRFGVPDSTGRIDWSIRAEPIAADCRPGGRPEQGWTTAAAYDEFLENQGKVSRTERSRLVREYAERLELAKLKVIAGALALPLGELTRRDKVRQLAKAKKRARLLVSATAVFGILAVAAVAMGWIANVRRIEAEDQRREANVQRLNAEAERKIAETHRMVAEEAKKIAETEKKQAIEALALSDFQEGVNLLPNLETERLGLVHLARSARAGNVSAAIRIWTLCQETSFWVAKQKPGSPAVTAYRKRLKQSEIPPMFSSLVIGGRRYSPSWYSQSEDGKRCVTVISEGMAGDGTISFRVWTTAGVPLGPWKEIQYDGLQYVSGIDGAIFSPDGRFLAVVSKAWREPSFIDVWDLDTGEIIGERLHAGGRNPNFQNAVFTDLWFGKAGNRNDDLFLFTLSSRGEAMANRIQNYGKSSSMSHAATNSHSQPVIAGSFDPETGLFASVSLDRTVRVSSTHDSVAVGWPIPLDMNATGISLSVEGLSVAFDDGGSKSWDLIPGASARKMENVAMKTAGAPGMDWEPRKDEEEERKKGLILADKKDGKELYIRDRIELQLKSGTVSGQWSRRFPSPISHARLLGDDLVMVQTDSFTTEIWDTVGNVPRFPIIDEMKLFSSGEESDTPLVTSISPDGKLALTRSFLWVPPNLGIYAFTVWDLNTGKPLSRRRLFADSENHSEFSADGSGVIYGLAESGQSAQVLQLKAGSEVVGLLPGLAEKLAGARLQADGHLEPIEDDPRADLDVVKKSLR